MESVHERRGCHDVLLPRSAAVEDGTILRSADDVLIRLALRPTVSNSYLMEGALAALTLRPQPGEINLHLGRVVNLPISLVQWAKVRRTCF